VRSRSGAAFVLATAAAAAACGSSKHDASGFDAGSTGGDSGVVATFDAGGNLCGASDCDGDGYAAPADCNDHDPAINPGAYDFKGDGVDNDCDGKVDDPTETCETVVTQVPGTPTDFARAADLCAQPGGFDPLVRAEWGSISGLGPSQQQWVSKTKDAQVGLVSSFGKNDTRQGRTMIGLATGIWGAPDPRNDPALDTDPNFHLNDACADIPISGLDCQSLSNGAPAGGVSVQDWAELRLWIKAPLNAGTLLFDFAFFSSEFNQFWNASLNDAFLVLVSSKSNNGTNVAKDAHGLAVTVNSGFFQLCPTPAPLGLSQDKAGALTQCAGVDGSSAASIFGSIGGTGYDGATAVTPSTNDTVLSAANQLYVYGGGSGWLSNRVPVVSGEELQMRIILFDTFDGLKDSAILLDAFRWEPGTSSGISRPPPR
jgi:hypothetical protein